jgi:hypothetical protein
MRIDNVTDPVYAPNSMGGPKADPVRATYAGLYALDGEMTRAAYTLHAEDDDYGQANTLLNEVYTEEQRERLVETVAGAASGVKSGEIRERVHQCWKNIDKARDLQHCCPTAPTVSTAAPYGAVPAPGDRPRSSSTSARRWRCSRPTPRSCRSSRSDDA